MNLPTARAGGPLGPGFEWNFIYNPSAGYALGFSVATLCPICCLRYVQRYAPNLECTTTYLMLHDVHFAPRAPYELLLRSTSIVVHVAMV